MRRVLYLARHFPPIGGAGVHRTLGSVSHLQRYGYGPIRWGAYPMAPWAGRIRDGRFTFRGRDVRLPLNLPPHAILPEEKQCILDVSLADIGRHAARGLDGVLAALEDVGRVEDDPGHLRADGLDIVR